MLLVLLPRWTLLEKERKFALFSRLLLLILVKGGGASLLLLLLLLLPLLVVLEKKGAAISEAKKEGVRETDIRLDGALSMAVAFTALKRWEADRAGGACCCCCCCCCCCWVSEALRCMCCQDG